MSIFMKQANSLYVRTSLTIFVALFIFMIFASVVVFQYLVQPIAKQASGDLSALMVLSSRTWVELLPDARSRFEQELKNYHDILITLEKPKLPRLSHKTPFTKFLKQALEKRLKQPIKFYEDISEDMIWIEINISENFIYVGISAHPVGANPPRVIFLLLLGAAILIFFTSSFLVRRLTQPLEKLSQAVIQMGRDTTVPVLQETGALELVMLTRSFNQMNFRVQQLLDNRNTLLAGISHDLRTPISRIYLALELMNGQGEDELIDGIRNDLIEIELLISQTLELAISKEKALEKIELVDINELVSLEVEKYQNKYNLIEWHSGSEVKHPISRTAFQRIFQNLIENAIRYGEGKAIKITLTFVNEEIKVCIIDQGPGIPEQYQSDVFQPFFRLETSRNSSTGGSGLGLAIVSQLCELYGWTIELKSNPAKKGCTFCLTLNQSI
ncbi:MAG: ATP-binding protein [Gammaproteobacteria bacterium]|nr:ATP-binding protein [Gammaproteobacteria bacterium]